MYVVLRPPPRSEFAGFILSRIGKSVNPESGNLQTLNKRNNIYISVCTYVCMCIYISPKYLHTNHWKG